MFRLDLRLKRSEPENVIRNRVAIVSWLVDYMADPLPSEVNAVAYQDADVPKSKGKGHAIPVGMNWRNFLPKIQTPEAYNWLVRPRMLWINRDDWMAECIGAGYGNFLEILRTITTSGGVFHEIRTLEYNMDLSRTDPKKFNWFTHPHLFGKCTARRKDNTIINVGSGYDCYFPNMKRTQHLWIHNDFVEILPPSPDGGYILQGMSVYTAGMQPLRLARKPGELIYPTSWKLKTAGVIPPR